MGSDGLETFQYRCYATASCGATFEAVVQATGDAPRVAGLMAEANGWGMGLHGTVCPDHRGGEFSGG